LRENDAGTDEERDGKTAQFHLRRKSHAHPPFFLQIERIKGIRGWFASPPFPGLSAKLPPGVEVDHSGEWAELESLGTSRDLRRS